jgi:hypothetical protein
MSNLKKTVIILLSIIFCLFCLYCGSEDDGAKEPSDNSSANTEGDGGASLSSKNLNCSGDKKEMCQPDIDPDRIPKDRIKPIVQP